MKYFFITLVTLIYFSFTLPKTVFAISDPLSVPNNKFGIHIISATDDEIIPAKELVNSNGDWGYVTVLMERKDKNHGKWQKIFDELRRLHLIPLLRIATEPAGNAWKRPDEGEEKVWADFLDSLNWPVKNRYVIIYNEPNHATEWGNFVDAKSYAEVLDKTITALKNKNSDFFVLNAGLDASTPYLPPKFLDEVSFINQMEKAVPGIFNKLDGWVSHSYPNPEFKGLPDDYGKGTIRTWEWERGLLDSMNIKKMPVFITETGWKHAEGIRFDNSLPSVELVTQYYQKCFLECWTNPNIVAVTPFLLSYQEEMFDHFSFKKFSGEKQTTKNKGVESTDSEFYPMYKTIQDMPKVLGKPVQDQKFELSKGEIYSSIVARETYTIFLTFKNTGQSIWNERDTLFLNPIQGGNKLGIEKIAIPKDVKVEPGQEYTFRLPLRAPQSGTYKIVLTLAEGNKSLDSAPVEFITEVKSPVILKIKGGLSWKNDFSGEYKLIITGITGQNERKMQFNKDGLSDDLEARFLLPDYEYEFSLDKPFYYPKQFKQKVSQGENILDFGNLKPNIFSALLNPKMLWQLLPFSK